MNDLPSLTEDLRTHAEVVLNFAGHKKAAALMIKAAEVIERLAPLDPESEVVKGQD